MKTLQVRNVPEELYERLQRRAAARGLSLSQLVREELELMDRPTMDEWLDRLAARPARTFSESAADAIRAERPGADE